MTSTRNFYRLEAYAKKGAGLSSNAVLVMGQDTVAPAQPIIIGAIIDSLDRAVVSWEANKESDLWGYRIFKANFKNDEFSLLNAYPTLDTILIDTIDIDLGVKDIFYLVEAADKRNNRSPLSDTIRIELPDRLPPLPPMIAKVEQRSDSILLYYANSGSEDAESLNFYRRNIAEKGWKKIFTIDQNDSISFTVDSLIEYGSHYAYTVTAVDGSGNESKPEYFKEIVAKKPEKEFIPFEKIDTSFSEEGKLNIAWRCGSDKVLKSVMVYKGTDPKYLSKLKLIDFPENSIVDDISKSEGKKIYYKLKPNFENQELPYMSDLITVDLSSSSKNNK